MKLHPVLLVSLALLVSSAPACGGDEGDPQITETATAVADDGAGVAIVTMTGDVAHSADGSEHLSPIDAHYTVSIADEEGGEETDLTEPALGTTETVYYMRTAGYILLAPFYDGNGAISDPTRVALDGAVTRIASPFGTANDQRFNDHYLPSPDGALIAAVHTAPLEAGALALLDADGETVALAPVDLGEGSFGVCWTAADELVLVDDGADVDTSNDVAFLVDLDDGALTPTELPDC